MKIKFDKLETSNESIKVSFNGGSSYENFGVENIRKRGIILDDSQNYGKIRIVGKSTVLKNLDVVKDICIPNKTFFLVDMYNNGGGLKRRYIEDTKAIVEKIPEAELSFDKDGEVYEDYPSKEDNLPRINASGIMVSILWLQDVFGTETFNAECLVNEYNEPYRPFGYLQNGQPLLYVFDIYNHSPIVYNDGTTQKYFYPSLIESENVAKELPTFRILLEDETVLEEKTIYIDYVSDKLYQVINDRPDDFSGYDWEVFRNVWEDYDEESDSYTESFQRYSTIIDKQVNVWDSLWLNNDLTLRICNKQEHVYYYNAQYVDDQSKFSISFTKSNPQLPDTPTKPFATFLGWYQDSNFRTKLNLGDIDSDTYIYAKWEYHDVTRKIIFEKDNIHFEFEVTKASNLSLRTSDLISYIREQDTTGCIKSISSRSNYTLYFNTDDDYIIPEDAYSISYTQKAIVVKYSDGSSQSFTYTPAPCTIGCKYEDILPNHTKSILQDSQITTPNGMVIDCQEALDTYMSTISSSVTLTEVLTYTPEIRLEFSNYEITNTSLSTNQIISSTGHINISLNTAVDVNVYVSTESIDKSNYKDASLICSGKYIREAYETIAAIENNTSVPSVSKVYLYLECKTTTGSIKFNYLDRNSYSANTSASFNFGQDIVVPRNYTELDELLNNALSTSRFSSDLDETIPDEHTYKINFIFNNETYLSGETIHVPEVPLSGMSSIIANYLPIAINYSREATIQSLDPVGRDVQYQKTVDLEFQDSSYSYITCKASSDETTYTITKIENTLYDKNFRIFRTPFEKSMNFTLSCIDKNKLNFLSGLGSISEAREVIVSNPDIQFFNGLGEELTQENKLKIIDSKIPSNYRNNRAMFLENNIVECGLPSIGNYSGEAAYVLNKNQLSYALLKLAAHVVFYYGDDSDDVEDASTIIKGSTKYTELYKDVKTNTYYNMDLTKKFSISKEPYFMSDIQTTVNPIIKDFYKGLYKKSKPDYLDITYAPDNSLCFENIVTMKNSYATNRNPSIVPESYELYLKIQNAFYKINYDSDNNCYNVDIHDSNNNDLGKVLGDDTYNKIKIYYVNSSSIWVWKGTEKGYDVGTEFVTFQRKNGQVLITECERSRNLSYYKYTQVLDKIVFGGDNFSYTNNGHARIDDGYSNSNFYYTTSEELRSDNMFSQPSGSEVIYDRNNKVDKELYFEVYVVYRKDTSTSIFVPKELNYCVVESGAVEFLEDNITTPTTYGEVIVPGENWDYQEEIFNSNEPVVVALSATWAGTWKQVASTFTTTAQNHPEIKFIKLDVDEHQEIIEALGFKSTPQYKSYINGVEHSDKAGGALTDQVLIELLS